MMVVDVLRNIWNTVNDLHEYAITRANPARSTHLATNIKDPPNNVGINNNEYKYKQRSLMSNHEHVMSHPAACGHECHVKLGSWKHALSVHCSHVPEKLREPFIEYGYFLPFMPWRYYLKGLYIPSYELTNVWTHLAPCIYFSYLLMGFAKEIDIVHAWPLFLITFSGIVICGLSSMAHLFHARSSLHHSCWFVADYFGITLYAYSSLTTNFYSGAEMEYYIWLSPYYLHISTVVCFIGFTSLCITQTKQPWISVKLARQIKLYVNGLGYMFGALPIFFRIGKYGLAEAALQNHTISFVCILVAPVTYAFDFPQCRFPGRFDIFGHSHMWFHIFTALSIWFDINAVYLDIINGPWQFIHMQVDFPTFVEPLFYYLIVVLYGIFCGHLTHCSVKCDHAEEEPFLQGKLRCACGLPRTMEETSQE